MSRREQEIERQGNIRNVREIREVGINVSRRGYKSVSLIRERVIGPGGARPVRTMSTMTTTML